MSDITDLKAEVLLLRQENKELRSERDKLRELCREIWTSCPVHESDCETCGHFRRTGGYISEPPVCELLVPLIELGVTA